MASKTNRTEKIRNNKLSKKGRVRKAKLRAKGSTASKKELFGDK